MEKNELRIGNWVLCNGLRTIVNDTLMISILKNDVQFTIDPIPLTPEILEKCGFEKMAGCFTLSRESELGHKFGDFHVSIYDDTQIKAWRGGRYIGVCKSAYLHQLQNLYFALTGEELTFKP